jgi:hypothetical protein
MISRLRIAWRRARLIVWFLKHESRKQRRPGASGNVTPFGAKAHKPDEGAVIAGPALLHETTSKSLEILIREDDDRIVRQLVRAVDKSFVPEAQRELRAAKARYGIPMDAGGES